MSAVAQKKTSRKRDSASALAWLYRVPKWRFRMDVELCGLNETRFVRAFKCSNSATTPGAAPRRRYLQRRN